MISLTRHSQLRDSDWIPADISVHLLAGGRLRFEVGRGATVDTIRFPDGAWRPPSPLPKPSTCPAALDPGEGDVTVRKVRTRPILLKDFAWQCCKRCKTWHCEVAGKDVKAQDVCALPSVVKEFIWDTGAATVQAVVMGCGDMMMRSNPLT
jgi:hypothetical protein